MTHTAAVAEERKYNYDDVFKMSETTCRGVCVPVR